MKLFCFTLQLACLVLGTIISAPAFADDQNPAKPAGSPATGQPATPPLLGKLENNRYIAPEELFSIELPFGKYEAGRHVIHDSVVFGSFNVLFEDTATNQRYRIELTELGDTSQQQFKHAAEARLSTYKGLLTRIYKGTPLLIHFANPAHETWEYYFRQDDGNDSHYHMFVFFRHKQHLAMLWTDFVEHDVTPAIEDSIINGEHPAIQATRQMFRSTTY